MLSRHVEKHHNPRARRSKTRRLILGGIWLAYVAGLFWLGLWVFWYVRVGNTAHDDVGFPQDWLIYYPELEQSGLTTAEIPPDDGTIDVLLLGGSVLEQVADELEQRLQSSIRDPLRVYKLPKAAHTSRDSYLKYSLLKDKHFDLVVFYHGINDVRMNCCPDRDFKDDYTHCHWYHSIERMAQNGRITMTGLLADQSRGLIALGEPEREALDYGDSVKTPRAFRKNLEGILQQAHAGGQPVMLMTFACYLPDGYTRKKFQAHQLGYGRGRHELPAEVWGKPENVVRTVQAHNREILELSTGPAVKAFVDQSRLMPADGTCFSDPCHFTPEGCRRFVDNMLPPLLEALELPP